MGPSFAMNFSLRTLERVMHFLEEKAVHCNYFQASSLGWQKKFTRKALGKAAIRAM
jgi:hypothetical protein